MDIRWVIIADEGRLNNDKSYDILRIRDGAKICGEFNTFPIMLIMKVHFVPTEVKENKIITLKVIHDKRGEVFSRNIPYTVPDLETWANRETYIQIKIREFKFSYSGFYDFKLFIDSEYKNETSLEVKEVS